MSQRGASQRIFDVLDWTGNIQPNGDREVVRQARVQVGMCLMAIALLPPLLVTGVWLGASPGANALVGLLFGAHLLAVIPIRRGRVVLASAILCTAINASL